MPSALERAEHGRTEHGMVQHGGMVIPYRIVRSARRRRTIELRIENDGVRVAAPLRTSVAEVEAFVRSRVPWIQKQRTSRPTPPQPVQFATGEQMPYQGRWLPLDVITSASKAARVDLDLLGLRVSVNDRISEDARPAVIETALRHWYRSRASEELPERVAYWAAQAAYAPSRVIVRDQKRRWGSCAPDGTLRLNWRLIMLDPRLIDYVVVHELAHLVRPHHRPSFWAEVERILPGSRSRRALLRAAGARLPM